MELWILRRLHAKLWVGVVEGAQGQVVRVGKGRRCPALTSQSQARLHRSLKASIALGDAIALGLSREGRTWT